MAKSSVGTVRTERMASSVVCSACGYQAAADDPYPFRCPGAGTDDGDHVMVRVLDSATVRFPDPAGRATEPNPFLRYRSLLHAYHLAAAGGLGDSYYRGLVERLDRELTRLDGGGFRATPFARHPSLSESLGCTGVGGTWVKDETGNVSGSHKGRHLMGLLLHLEVAQQLGLVDPAQQPHLAIASCGNAALAAAVVAAAGGRRLQVFVPVDADPRVLGRLQELGAQIVVCPREAGVAGDPTYLRLQAELATGAIPFTCQGTENGLAIEGGLTLGYEIATDLAAAGEELDHVVVQVGGGALASAVWQGLREAFELGALTRLPRLHAVQTAAAYPLARAYDRVREMLPAEPTPAEVDRALRTAARHRSSYMWPWETEPKSIAHGILDDETYDWRAVVGGMLATGGEPVVVDEDLLAEANAVAVGTTGIPVDPTGSAGLAGVLALRRSGRITASERTAVLFTGVSR